MSKRSELQKKFDDTLDAAMGHFRFNRYGRCAMSLAPLGISGVRLAVNKLTLPHGSMDAVEVSASLEHEARIESHVTAVLEVPTIAPAPAYGVSFLYSQWRQGRLERQLSDAEQTGPF